MSRGHFIREAQGGLWISVKWLDTFVILQPKRGGEAKEIESEEWDAIDEGLASYELVADNLDALTKIIELTDNYIDEFQDLK